MRALVQRVRRASVAVAGEQVAAIGRGLLVFLAVAREDSPEDASYIADKVVGLRIFPDESGRLDRSAQEIGAELLVVSQFTLYADTRRGRRPSFTQAASPDVASREFDRVVDLFLATGLRVATGRFQAFMEVSLVNDGPVTIWIDSADRHRPRR